MREKEHERQIEISYEVQFSEFVHTQPVIAITARRGGFPIRANRSNHFSISHSATFFMFDQNFHQRLQYVPRCPTRGSGSVRIGRSKFEQQVKRRTRRRPLEMCYHCDIIAALLLQIVECLPIIQHVQASRIFFFSKRLATGPLGPCQAGPQKRVPIIGLLKLAHPNHRAF